MFVRFRRQGRPLQASLIETRRVAGKVTAEHVGALGSVDADLSVRERLAFWSKLPQRLASLGNRVGPDQHEAQMSEAMRDMAEGSVAGHKRVIADAEDAIAKAQPAASAFAADAADARARLAKLKRGESVSGGLGKRPDALAMFKAAGWTPRQISRAMRLASLTEDEFKMLEGRIYIGLDASEKALDREARRIIRERDRTLA